MYTFSQHIQVTNKIDLFTISQLSSVKVNIDCICYSKMGNQCYVESLNILGNSCNSYLKPSEFF